MIPQATIDKAIRAIHSFPELKGCTIGLHANNQSKVLFSGLCLTPNSERVIVIIEECISNDPGDLRDLRQWAATPSGVSSKNAANPTIIKNRSLVGRELVGAGLSCGFTAISVIGVVGGVASELPTGGFSSFLVVASWAGLITQGVQCVNGIVRLAAIAIDLDDNTLQRWDNTTAYSTTILVVDAVGVVSSVAGLATGTRNLWAIISRQRAFTSRNLTLETLKRMNRNERIRVIGEAVEEASKTPAGRDALIKSAREANIGVKSIQNTTGLSVKNAQKMVRIITDETSRRLSASLRDVFANAGSIGLSATPPRWTGSGSGSINWIINVIDAGAVAQ